MAAGTVGEIIYSTHENFKTGDLVSGAWGWTEYALLHPEKAARPLRKVENIDPVDFLALGLTVRYYDHFPNAVLNIHYENYY